MPAIFPQHEDRQSIQDEEHARPPMPIEKPEAQAWHWVLHGCAGQSDLWPDAFDRSARHQLIACDNGVIRFERHTEFAAITFFGENEPGSSTLDLISACPGRQIAGAKIVISESARLDDLFGTSRLFGGEALFSGVIVSTDFQINDKGLITYAVSGKFEDAYGRGRLVKRLLDLKTYRMASLLALPLVRRLTPQLETLERRAMDATDTVAGEVLDLQSAVEDLSASLKAVARFKSSAAFRISAAYAYDDLVAARPTSLNETPVGQRQTLRGFVEHRLRPGINSIRAFEARTERVARTVADALALARTQLDQVAQRNAEALLSSMEKRARQQVHLSQAVEGLSVAAITYYLVGLFGTALKAIPGTGVPISQTQAVSIPLIALFVWWNVCRAKGLLKTL
jgi:uncharacterized membrane-anchored protein